MPRTSTLPTKRLVRPLQRDTHVHQPCGDGALYGIYGEGAVRREASSQMKTMNRPFGGLLIATSALLATFR